MNQFDWDKAKIIFGIPDMAGIEDNIYAELGRKEDCGCSQVWHQSKIIKSGVSVPVDLTGKEENILVSVYSFKTKRQSDDTFCTYWKRNHCEI